MEKDEPQKGKPVPPPKPESLLPRPTPIPLQDWLRISRALAPSAQGDTITSPNSPRAIPPQNREAAGSSLPSGILKVTLKTSKRQQRKPMVSIQGNYSVQQLVEKFQTQGSISTPTRSPLRQNVKAGKIGITIAQLEQMSVHSPSSSRWKHERPRACQTVQTETTDSMTTAPSTVETRSTDCLPAHDETEIALSNQSASLTSTQGKNVEKASPTASKMSKPRASQSHSASKGDVHLVRVQWRRDLPYNVHLELLEHKQSTAKLDSKGKSLSSGEQELNLASGTSIPTRVSPLDHSEMSTRHGSSLDDTTDKEIFDADSDPSAIFKRARHDSIDSITHELEIPLSGQLGEQLIVTEGPKFESGTSKPTDDTVTEVPSEISPQDSTDSTDSISEKPEIPEGSRSESRSPKLSREATKSVVPASLKRVRDLRKRPLLDRPGTPLPERRVEPSSSESE